MAEDHTAMSAATSGGADAATVLALFDLLPELIVLIEADGRIRHVNRRLLDTMGYALSLIHI